MRGLTKADLEDLVFRLQEEGQEVLRIVREKGWKTYQTPLIVAAGLLLIVYLGAYRATASKKAALFKAIDGEKARSEHAETYEMLKAKMLGYYFRMPKPDQKDGWLFNKVLQAAEHNGIELESIGSQAEATSGDLWILSQAISAKVDYTRLGRWIESLENQKPAVFVSRLEVKKPDDFEKGDGSLAVEMVLSTIMPKKVTKL
jgi:hypothetical protein